MMKIDVESVIKVYFYFSEIKKKKKIIENLCKFKMDPDYFKKKTFNCK